jgi:hypothetical protein
LLFLLIVNSTKSHTGDHASELISMFKLSPNQDAIVSVFSSTGFPECADCYKLLHQFWCAQTVPSCGIFDKVIDEILVSSIDNCAMY